MAAHAKELVQLRQLESAHTTQGDLDDDSDKSNDRHEDYNEYQYNSIDHDTGDSDVFVDGDGEDSANCDGE